MITAEEFEADLTRLLTLHKDCLHALTNAAACQTAYDRRHANRAQEAFDEAEERFLEKWKPRLHAANTRNTTQCEVTVVGPVQSGTLRPHPR